MARFVQLTAADGEPIWVNPEHVYMVFRCLDADSSGVKRPHLGDYKGPTSWLIGVKVPQNVAEYFVRGHPAEVIDALSEGMVETS